MFKQGRDAWNQVNLDYLLCKVKILRQLLGKHRQFRDTAERSLIAEKHKFRRMPSSCAGVIKNCSSLDASYTNLTEQKPKHNVEVNWVMCDVWHSQGLTSSKMNNAKHGCNTPVTQVYKESASICEGKVVTLLSAKETEWNCGGFGKNRSRPSVRQAEKRKSVSLQWAKHFPQSILWIAAIFAWCISFKQLDFHTFGWWNLFLHVWCVKWVHCDLPEVVRCCMSCVTRHRKAVALFLLLDWIISSKSLEIFKDL